MSRDQHCWHNHKIMCENFKNKLNYCTCCAWFMECCEGGGGSDDGPTLKWCDEAKWCNCPMPMPIPMWWPMCNRLPSIFGFISKPGELCDIDDGCIVDSPPFFLTVLRSFARRFWNHIFTWRSDNCSVWANSDFLRIVMYLDVWYSFSNSSRW